jgi:DNA-binding protein YbaB
MPYDRDDCGGWVGDRRKGARTVVDYKERPDWSALASSVNDLQAASKKMAEMQRRMLTINGVAWSDDRLVKAVVGPRGHLIELDIDPRVYRTPNSQALATTIVKTAIEQTQEQAEELMGELVPSDARSAGSDVAGAKMRALGRTHDADLSIEEDDHGLS